MEFLKAYGDWVLLVVSGVFSGIGSIVFYHYRKANEIRKSEIDKIQNRLDQLEQKYHTLSLSQAETSVEIRAIKEDIGYIRLGLDKILERL